MNAARRLLQATLDWQAQSGHLAVKRQPTWGMSVASGASMRAVTHIISIGKACRVTYQLRRHFNFGLSFPFDWWVSRPEGIIAALSPGFDPYSPDFIEERVVSGVIKGITSCNGAISFHHEFGRDSSNPSKPIIPDWRDQISKNREVFMRRRQRMLDLNTTNEHILFVRHAFKDEAGFDPVFAKLESTFDRADFSVLLLNQTLPVKKNDRIFQATIIDSPAHMRQAAWKGIDGEWDTLFASTGFRLENKDLPPFRDIRIGKEALEEIRG